MQVSLHDSTLLAYALQLASFGDRWELLGAENSRIILTIHAFLGA